MTTKEVADRLVRLCSEGKFEEAVGELYSDNIVSVEAGAPPGQSRETTGIAAIRERNKWWGANHDIHSSAVEGPLVADPYFSVSFKMDITFKPKQKRFTMEEIAVYKVADGKIVREEFFYAT